MDTEIHELTAGYALDALDPAEREVFERHLASCERCQEELASFWEVTSALAVAADSRAPSAGLRDRILADARAEKQTVVPIESRRRVSPVLASVTAIAAAVAIGLGIYSIALNGRLDDTRAALTAQESVAAVLADPNATSTALESGSGRVVVDDAGEAVLVMNDLPSAPTGKTYQAWIVEGNTQTSAGTFDTTDKQAIVRIPEPVPDGAVIGVTLENAGGASAPTLPLVAASAPV